MRGRPIALLSALVLAVPASASATPVLLMSRDGRVSLRQDRFLAHRPFTPAPSVAVASAVASSASAARHGPRRQQRTVRSELTRLYRTHQIDSADYRRYNASFSAALAAVKRLGGTRAAELEAVVENLHQIAVAGMLTPSRLAVLFLTLDRNRQWWTTGPIPYSGQLIEFSGSQLAWEYYPGQGLELQPLATFGRADGMYTAGPSQYSQMRQLLDEMIPLAARRGGGVAWEYYFHFDGGSPPWVSAMAQGTGLEALTRASKAFGPLSGSGGASAQPSGSTYLQTAQRALGIFNLRPSLGVSEPTRRGARYLQYSFAPGVDIINAFLQSLIGLYDYAHTSGDAQARRLFAAGDAQARAELPSFDTGAWSLYQPGVEDTLDYHRLVTGFLDELCSRTGASVYCTTAQHFHAYLTTPPSLTLLTTRAIPMRPVALRFRLSKYSHVGVVIVRGQSTVFETSAYFSYGASSFSLPALTKGTYTVRLAATDLAGNFHRIIGTLQVSRPPGSS